MALNDRISSLQKSQHFIPRVKAFLRTHFFDPRCVNAISNKQIDAPLHRSEPYSRVETRNRWNRTDSGEVALPFRINASASKTYLCEAVSNLDHAAVNSL